jgi:hypothetical protein
VTNTADDDTPENHGETTRLGVGNISEEQGKSVSQQGEGLTDSVL